MEKEVNMVVLETYKSLHPFGKLISWNQVAAKCF